MGRRLVSDGATRIETINELKIWLEGEFKLIKQGQETSRDDIKQVRTRLHDLSNHVSALTALDIPGKMDGLRTEVQKHDNIIEKIATEQTSLKATMRTAYLAIGIAGAAIGSIVTLVLKVAETFHIGG